VANNFDTTKTPKLLPNWKGPAEIIDINDTNAKAQFKNKIKMLHISKQKNQVKKKMTKMILIRLRMCSKMFLIKRTIAGQSQEPRQN
jgi:hypothetical protein